jgi:cytochrome c biogenesis factor
LTLLNLSMNSKKYTITILFSVIEIIVGTILGQIYINSYSFWTSDQTLEQFFATVITIYFVTVLSLGILNLSILKQLDRSRLIRCVITSVVIGIVSTILVVTAPKHTFTHLDALDISPAVIILLGLIIGFNWQLLIKREE